MDTAPSTLNEEKKSEPQAVVVRREPDQDLVTWTAASRPFKKRDRQFFVTIFAIAGIISLVLFLAEGLMPVILIVALVFLYYVLSTVPPENVEYKITTKGVKIDNKLTGWPNMISFWFGKSTGADILFFQTVSIPGRIQLVITSEIEADLKKEISTYVPYQESSVSSLDKVTNWFAQKLPGNK